MKFVTTFVAFCAGGVAVINLNILLAPVQDNYDAQWWKVVAAITLVIVLSVLDHYQEKDWKL